MEGQVVSHYRILERLGGGGMGVVYKAQDERLKRLVALKFLPPDLTRDDEARQRFMHEAQAASALDHPNICTIHEIDTTPDGRLFLAMACYDGETLRSKIKRGPLSFADAIDVATQTAQGLAKAHAAGIVHRDIKPANLILTNEGTLKIVDFGIAKLSGATELTRTGMSPGTIAYMAPEQLTGGPIDHRADLWALGVVLYEVLTGRRPFETNNQAAIITAILDKDPQPVGATRPATPPALQRIVARLLQRDPEARYGSALEVRQDLEACLQHLNASPVPDVTSAIWQALRRPRVAGAVAAALLTAVAIGGWSWSRGADAREIRTATIPEIARLIDQGNLAAAFALAERAERIVHDDPELTKLWPKMSSRVSFETTPPGGHVSFRQYGDVDGAWTALGPAPVTSPRLPRGLLRLQVKLDGYETLETFVRVGAEPTSTVRRALRQQTEVPAGMVPIDAGPVVPGFVAFPAESVPSPGYFLDRTEVTNAAYRAFVERGAYQDKQYWREPFAQQNRPVSWDSAMASFVDTTGRPGPSTWTAGTFPEGQGDYPVSGVSWYEAVAYCESVGKSLPTIYHWGSAASILALDSIIPVSNFSHKGLVPADDSRSLSNRGTYNMAGNVREWAWNAAADGRYILGGSWDDADYRFYEPEARPPMDRANANGFRCAKFADWTALPAVTKEPMLLDRRDYSREKPVSAEVFEAYKNLYTYDKVELEPVVEIVGETARWRKEKVTFTTAYDRTQRMIAYLFVPKSGKPPYQTVVYFPGAFGFARTSSVSLEPEESWWSFLPTSGRAFMFPIFDGTYDRNRGELRSGRMRDSRLYRNYAIRWVQDFMRSVDYLETRTDIDSTKVAALAASWGVQFTPTLVSVDPRISAVVMPLAGLPMTRGLPEVDPFNFVRHAKRPLLLMGAEFDSGFPIETAQRPLFDQWGASADKKRYVVMKGIGHELFRAQNELIREILPWLDTHLGPVE